MAPHVTRLVFRMFRGALVGLDVSEGCLNSAAGARQEFMVCTKGF